MELKEQQIQTQLQQAQQQLILNGIERLITPLFLAYFRRILLILNGIESLSLLAMTIILTVLLILNGIESVYLHYTVHSPELLLLILNGIER